MILIPVVNGQEGAGPDETEVDIVRIEIDEERITLDVSVGGNATGILHCKAVLIADHGILISQVTVTLTVETDEYSFVELSVYTFNLSTQEPELEFTARVTAEPGTSSSIESLVTIDGIVKVQQSHPGFSFGVKEDNAEVWYAPYYMGRVLFQVPDGELIILKGEEKTFDLLVENTGNVGEIFHIFVINSGELANDGVEVTFSEESISLEEGGDGTIEATVNVGDDAGGRNVTVKIGIWADHKGMGDPEKQEAWLPFTIKDAFRNFIQNLFSSPIFLWVLLAVVIALIGLAAFGLIKLKQHLEFRRELTRLKRGPPDR